MEKEEIPFDPKKVPLTLLKVYFNELTNGVYDVICYEVKRFGDVCFIMFSGTKVWETKIENINSVKEIPNPLPA